MLNESGSGLRERKSCPGLLLHKGWGGPASFDAGPGKEREGGGGKIASPAGLGWEEVRGGACLVVWRAEENLLSRHLQETAERAEEGSF